jgi:hypothetical protein
MAIEDFRKEWQKFKKAYPDFEKNKSFKSDVGPQFDTLGKIHVEAEKAISNLSAKFEEGVKVLKSVKGALKGYEVVASQLKGSHKTIMKDFAWFSDAVEEMSDAYEKACKDLGRITQ